MKSLTATFFLCKVRYERTMEDGTQKKVTEAYVLTAESFTEAEAKIIQEIAPYEGEIEVVEIDRAQFREFFYDKDRPAYKYYKAKLQFITLDEKSEKEKKTSVCYLVGADNLEMARRGVEEIFSDTMIDYNIVSLTETPIENVFVYEQGGV